jgi:hypothetical protein
MNIHTHMSNQSTSAQVQHTTAHPSGKRNRAPVGHTNGGGGTAHRKSSTINDRAANDQARDVAESDVQLTMFYVVTL